MKRTASILALVALLAGCDSLDNQPNQSSVDVQFEVASTSSAKSPLSSGMAAVTAADGELTIAGTNGVLTLTDVRLLVAKFKLEREEDSCDHDEDDGADHEGAETGDAAEGVDNDDDDRDCDTFEAAPSFVSLPLGGGAVTVSTGIIPAGTYEEMEFEVKDIDFDEEDGEDASFAALAQSIRTAFPNWPDEASIVFAGTFTPTGGEPRPFTTFAKGEIEVELEFDPALVIGGDGDDHDLTVVVDPALWFHQIDGNVLDLSTYDFEGDDDLLEFEVKLKDGFAELKIEDEDDDRDDDDRDDN